MYKLFFLVLLIRSQFAFANVVGTDLQNFNATTSGIDYVTVHSSEVLEPGIFNLGLMTNYAANSLPVFEKEGEEQNRINLNDSLLTGEVLFGLGIFKNFELGIAAGRLIRQDIDNNDIGLGRYDHGGWTNFRFGFKYRLLKRANDGFAISSLVNVNNIKNNPYLGQNQSKIYHFEGIYDRDFGPLTGSVNLGYRWRYSGGKLDGSLIDPTKDQLIASVGTSYLVTSLDTKLIVEVFGSRPMKKPGSDSSSRQASSLEVIGGLKYDWSHNLAFHVGGGSELLHGVSSPDWRVYAGVNWTTGRAYESIWEKTEMFKTEFVEVTKEEEKVILYSIHFETDSSDLTLPGSIKAIEDFHNYLLSLGPYSKLVIEGHTDSVGAAAYNQMLSLRRATSIRERLAKTYKIPIEKMEVEGYGEMRPIADNGNFQGRLKNRRVEIRIIK